jgi:hypothetical protein
MPNRREASSMMRVVMLLKGERCCLGSLDWKEVKRLLDGKLCGGMMWERRGRRNL